MKIRNTEPYRDKESGEIQKAGDVREVPAKRGKELIKKGVAEMVEESDANAL